MGRGVRLVVFAESYFMIRVLLFVLVAVFLLLP